MTTTRVAGPIIDTATATEPWLLAFDIDGTLMDKDGTLTAAVVDALAAVSDRGHHVVLSTGRSVNATVPVCQLIGQRDGWAVASNGSVITRLDSALPGGHEITDIETFDPAPAARLLREHLPEAIFAVEDIGVGYRLTAPFPDGELTGTQTVVTFDELIAQPATRLTIRSPELSSGDFHELIRAIGLRGVAYAVGYLAWLDLNPNGISKASGLERVRRRLGVGSARTLAVGDGFNDIEMLRWAAHGVAMGGSEPEVIAAADAVTGTVADNGVVDVLQWWLTELG